MSVEHERHVIAESQAIAQADPGAGIDPAEIIVVVPALNEAKHIESTLTQLVSGAPGLKQARFVVADGGSTDGTRKIVARLAARHPNVRLIDNPARLQSAGVNRAVTECAEAHHRYLVRCDAHATYPEGYVLKVVESLERHDSAALATVMDSVGVTCFQSAAGWASDSALGSGKSRHRGGRESGFVDHGHHAGFRLDLWRQIGGYAEDFATNEDAELDYRLHQAGGRIWLDADIRLQYFPRQTPWALARQYWKYGRGRARTLRRHRMRPRLRQMLPVVLTAFVVMGAATMPWLPVMAVLPAGYLAILLAVSMQMALSRNSLCGLWSGVALIAMHLPWGTGFLWQMFVARGR